MAAMVFQTITPMLAAEAEDGWRNLTKVTRDGSYTVLLRDARCLAGRLISVDDQGLVLGGDSGVETTVERADILRFSDASSATPDAAIFNGRSSWTDVKASAPRSPEYLQIVAKHGEEQNWKQPTIRDDAVASEGKTIAKADIRYVFLVRFKPLTKSEAYLHEEHADLLAPRLWFNGLMLGKISVLLYNSALPEHNAPVGCH